MKQFGKIFGFELKYYLKNKIFVGVTLFLVLLIAAGLFFPQISALFKGSKDKDASADAPVMLVSVSGERAQEYAAAFSAAFADYNVKITDDDEETVKVLITAGEAECAFVISSDTEYTYYVNNLSVYDSNSAAAEGVMQKMYQLAAMINGGMTEEQAAAAMSVRINGKTESLGTDQAQNYWYTYIMIFALYMVILLYGQMVATNVATEKSSRAMELLITSAKPTSMMFGKVLASCTAGLIQLTAVFGSAVLFYSINKSSWKNNGIITSIFGMPPQLLGFMLLFFVLGFLIYAFMFGAVGSTASKLEDINTSVMPITFLFIIGFMVVMFSFVSGNVDNTLMKVCSYLPFTSSMAMFTRIAMSRVPWYEIAISVIILILSVWGIGALAAKIYRVGVLLYGTPPKIGALLKTVLRSKKTK